jgi:hypothetical protein
MDASILAALVDRARSVIEQGRQLECAAMVDAGQQLLVTLT